VHYDGGDHQVLALAGTSVRLRATDGAETVVLAGHLFAAPGFAVIDGAATAQVEPFGLLDSLPAEVLEVAKRWERHVVEVETGLPPAPKPAPSATSTARRRLRSPQPTTSDHSGGVRLPRQRRQSSNLARPRPAAGQVTSSVAASR
jgi:hypothetical protein